MKSFNKIFISYEAFNIMSTHCTKNLFKYIHESNMKTFNKRLFTSYEAFNILQHKPCKNQNCSPKINIYLF